MSLPNDLLQNELKHEDWSLDYDYDDEDEAMSHLEWESGREYRTEPMVKPTTTNDLTEVMICGYPLSWWLKQPAPVELVDPRTGKVTTLSTDNREQRGY